MHIGQCKVIILKCVISSNEISAAYMCFKGGFLAWNLHKAHMQFSSSFVLRKTVGFSEQIMCLWIFPREMEVVVHIFSLGYCHLQLKVL